MEIAEKGGVLENNFKGWIYSVWQEARNSQNGQCKTMKVRGEYFAISASLDALMSIFWLFIWLYNILNWFYLQI